MNKQIMVKKTAKLTESKMDEGVKSNKSEPVKAKAPKTKAKAPKSQKSELETKVETVQPDSKNAKPPKESSKKKKSKKDAKSSKDVLVDEHSEHSEHSENTSKGVKEFSLTPVDKKSFITKNAICRLLYRAGVKRIGISVYDEIRKIMTRKISDVMLRVILFVDYDNRKTVMEEDVKNAAEHLGINMLAGLNKNAHKTKNLQGCISSANITTSSSRRYKPGMVALKKIKKFQRESDCLLIPKQNFKRLTLDISQKLDKKFTKYKQGYIPLWIEKENGRNDTLRFKKEVIYLVQLWIENYIVKLCTQANLLAQHAKRETVYKKDVKLAKNICATFE